MIIDPLYFVISFIIGLCYIHFTKEPNKVIIKYPTPYNIGKVTYVDDAGVCYKYAMNEVACPENKKKIIEMPIQSSETGYIEAQKKRAEIEAKSSGGVGSGIIETITNKIKSLFGNRV